MLEKIGKKIEEIRKKPEHVRLRYVWILVSVIMVFIIIVWIFSLQESFSQTRTSDISTPNLKDQFNNMENMPSLKDLMNQGGSLQEENSQPAENLQKEGVNLEQ